jgi:hypothetical protein
LASRCAKLNRSNKKIKASIINKEHVSGLCYPHHLNIEDNRKHRTMHVENEEQRVMIGHVSLLSQEFKQQGSKE